MWWFAPPPFNSRRKHLHVGNGSFTVAEWFAPKTSLPADNEKHSRLVLSAEIDQSIAIVTPEKIAKGLYTYPLEMCL